MKKLVTLSLFLLAICANGYSMMPPMPADTVSNQPVSSCDWCKSVVPLIQERLKSKFEHHQKEKEEEEHDDDDEEDESDDEVVNLPVEPIPQDDIQFLVDPAVPQEPQEQGRPVVLSQDAIDAIEYRIPNAEIRRPRLPGKYKTFHRYSVDQKENEDKEVKEEHEGKYKHGKGHKHGNKGHGHGHGHGHGKGKGKCGEKARFEICQNFGQSKECHEFLKNYGKIIVKKIFRGEDNICENLIDITLNRNNAFMCSPEMNILPWNPSDVSSDNSFDLFISLMKEMIGMNSNNNEVVQTTEVVSDQNGNVWQKTETVIKSSESGSWVDVVVVEQVGNSWGPEDTVTVIEDGGDNLWYKPEEKQCIFSRIKSAIVNEYHEHKSFYLSFFFTFAGLYCLLSCCKSKKKCCRNKYQQLPQQVPTECCLEKEKNMPPPPAYDPIITNANNYPGNVVVQIGLVSPTKEKVVQRPI